MRRLLLAVALLVAACGDDAEESASSTTTTSTTTTTTTEAPALACSAAVLSNHATDDQPDLPAAVAGTRAAIIEAAVACDYDALRALAADDGFTFSFGGGESAAEHWRDEEAQGQEPLRLLVETLRLPPVTEEGMVAWPSAHQTSPTDADWDALVPLYDEEEVQAWRDGGSGFLGYRVGISVAGDWRYFVAGD